MSDDNINRNIIRNLQDTVTLLDEQYQHNKRMFGHGSGHYRRKIKAIRSAISIIKEQDK